MPQRHLTFVCGSIAQLGEHLPYKQGVIGSSPIAPTIFFVHLLEIIYSHSIARS